MAKRFTFAAAASASSPRSFVITDADTGEEARVSAPALASDSTLASSPVLSHGRGRSSNSAPPSPVSAAVYPYGDIVIDVAYVLKHKIPEDEKQLVLFEKVVDKYVASVLLTINQNVARKNQATISTAKRAAQTAVIDWKTRVYNLFNEDDYTRDGAKWYFTKGAGAVGIIQELNEIRHLATRP